MRCAPANPAKAGSAAAPAAKFGHGLAMAALMGHLVPPWLPNEP